MPVNQASRNLDTCKTGVKYDNMLTCQIRQRADRLGCVDERQPTDKKQGKDQDKTRVSLSMRRRRGACVNVVATLSPLGRQGSVAKM